MGPGGARSRSRSPSASPRARSRTRTSSLPFERIVAALAEAWRRASCLSHIGHQNARAGTRRRVLVAGATGFAGALAAQLLWRHPRFELVAVTGRSNVGRPLAELYPRYRVPLAVQELDPAQPPSVDAAIVAYPHAAAAPTVAALREARRARRRPERRLSAALARDLRALVRHASAPGAARGSRLRAHRAPPRRDRGRGDRRESRAATRPPPCSGSLRSRARGSSRTS